MKNIIIIFLILVSISSCKISPDEKINNENIAVITGHLKEGDNMKVLFTSTESGSSMAIDTVTLNSEGEFSYILKLEKTGFFQLRNEGGNSITLLCSPGDSIGINSNYYNFSRYILSGSKDLEQITILNEKTQDFLLEIGEYSRIIQDSIYSINYSNIRMEIDSSYRKSFKQYKEFSTRYINKNSSSLVSLLALSNQLGKDFFVFQPGKDFELFQRVDSALYALYPDEEAVRNLHTEVARIRKSAIKQIDSAKMTGDNAPDFTMTDSDGIPVTISDYSKETILLVFGASWCEDCTEFNKNLVKVYNKYKEKGFRIVHVSLDNSKEKWMEWIQHNPSEWIHLNDFNFWDNLAIKLYSVEKIPFNFLINNSFKIVSVNLNFEELEKELKRIFED